MSGMTRRDLLKGAVVGAASAAGGLVGRDAVSAAGPRPNILFLFSDQHNAGVLGCEGHPDVRTPNLDRLAEDGTRFARAYCQDGVCVPSRTSMMAGQYPRTLGVLHNADRPPSSPEIPEIRPLQKVLNESGYRTAAFGKRHLARAADGGWDRTCTTMKMNNDPSDECYWDWIEERGKLEAFKRDWASEFGKGISTPMASSVSRLAPDETMEAYTAARTMEFISECAKGDRPFFAWCSFYHPHQPYTPIRKYADMYDQGRIRLPATLKEPAANLPPALQRWRRRQTSPWCLAKATKDVRLYRAYIAYYYALCTEIDHHVGRIRALLEKEGLADNTIVVYAADHGDFVGAHGMIEKCAIGHNVYEDTLRVPLIVHWPGRFRKGVTCKDLVELVDLYPTLLDAAGVKAPRDYRPAGRSLVPALTKGEAVGRRYAVSENWSQVSVITERYKLGHWLAPPVYAKRFGNIDFRAHGDMMFDRETDPGETRNLAGKARARAIEEELRAHLADWEKRTPSKAKDVLGAKPFARKRKRKKRKRR